MISSPRIAEIPERKLVGMSIQMSVNDNKNFKLFSAFMPRRTEIMNALDENVLDLRVYPKGYFKKFDPNQFFVKWALKEVSDHEKIPDNMFPFILDNGIYAVFNHLGHGSDIEPFHYIFQTWLPDSEYVIDTRPHFEILGPDYKKDSADSKQEIWIPIREPS